jgi:hypothetical protein
MVITGYKTFICRRLPALQSLHVIRANIATVGGFVNINLKHGEVLRAVAMAHVE